MKKIKKARMEKEEKCNDIIYIHQVEIKFAWEFIAINVSCFISIALFSIHNYQASVQASWCCFCWMSCYRRSSLSLSQGINFKCRIFFPSSRIFADFLMKLFFSNSWHFFVAFYHGKYILRTLLALEFKSHESIVFFEIKNSSFFWWRKDKQMQNLWFILIELSLYYRKKDIFKMLIKRDFLPSSRPLPFSTFQTFFMLFAIVGWKTEKNEKIAVVWVFFVF